MKPAWLERRPLRAAFKQDQLCVKKKNGVVLQSNTNELINHVGNPNIWTYIPVENEQQVRAYRPLGGRAAVQVYTNDATAALVLYTSLELHS